RLHLRAQRLVRSRKFLELPLRDLYHHVVERGLKARRRLARNVVRNLVQRVAHRQLGRDFRDREPRRLRRQRRRTRYPWVHLDHHHAPRGGLHGKLNVRAAGLHPDLADHLDGRVAHRLVLAVGERLRRRYGDRISLMHTHGIEVLDRAHDDHVVPQVAHHFQFELLPPQHRLFDQHLVHRRKVQPARQQLQQLLAVVGNAAARTAQGERRPQDHREPDLPAELQPVFQVVDQRRARHVQPDPRHRVLEQQPVFRLLDRPQLRPDELHSVLLQYAAVRQIHRQVQCRLPSYCGQQRNPCVLVIPSLARDLHFLSSLVLSFVIPSIARDLHFLSSFVSPGVARDLHFLFSFVIPSVARDLHLRLNANDLFQILARKRLDVRAVGHLGIGHDGRRIGIRQHHLIPLRLQRLARLRARVVKLRRLPDHNRPRANHENFGDVIASWHLIGLQSNSLHSNPLVIHPARPQCLSRKPPPLSSRESAFLMLLSRGAPYACHPDAPRLLSSREAQRRGICSPPLTLTFHSEALVIPTPHACCHPEERSDEGSAVPHSPLRSIPRPLSSRRPTLVVIPRSAATRDLQSPHTNPQTSPAMSDSPLESMRSSSRATTF